MSGLRRALQISHRPAAGLAALGAFWGAYAAWLPAVKARAGFEDATMGMVMLGAAVGNIAAMAVYPALARRLGPRMLPLTALALSLAALAQLAGAGGPVALFAAFAVMGVAMASIDVACNVRISVLEAQYGVPLMNLGHGLYSLAFAVSAALAGVARAAGAPQAVVVGVIMLLLLGVAAHMRGDGVAGPRESAALAPTPMPWAAVLPAALILMAAFMSENATETWSALHIERTLGGQPGEGAFGPAMMGLMMAIGRLSGQAVAARLGEARLVAISTVIAMAGAMMLAAAPSREIAVAGVALIGIGVAVVVPSANSLLGRRVAPQDRPRAISRAFMLGFTGFFIGPVAMGWVSQGGGLRLGFAAVTGVMALILLGLWALLRRPVLA
ncbi:MFS transporter [Paracoccus suum]|uniref:MFS transporter n=1 Tax=Paracoccus suum TaxID=2259340 RepID=A0A344PL62_9RHOB|nr:MFS transporter [Paracoccus suum]AXC50117.1 MFS transporter [Paracoccus suum]